MSNTHQVDISTPEGREQPVFVKTSPEVTIEKGFHYLGWGMLLLVRSYLLMWKTSKYLFDSVKSLTSVDKEIEEQQEAARRIIQAGLYLSAYQKAISRSDGKPLYVGWEKR